MPASIDDLFRRFAASGDPRPLGEVFDRCSGELLSLALHLCSEPADAEDALQATFVTAIEKRAERDAARPLRPWLSGILVLHCKKLRERRARRREAELGELVGDDGSVVAASERRELIERLRTHVQALPEEQRGAVLLQLEHGLQPAQIAEVLGVAPGTVRMRLWRGLRALRSVLPAGLAALLGALLPARGVAAVRQAVVRHAAKVAAATVMGGGLLMTKLLAGAAAILLLLVAWIMWPAPAAPRGATLDASVPALVGAIGTGPEAAPMPVANERTAVTASAPVRAAVAKLVVRLVWDQDGTPLPNLPLQLVPVRSDCDPTFDPIDAITGVDGECTVNVSAAGTFRIETIGGLRQLVELHRGTTVTTELRVPSAEPPVQRLHGHVMLADGAPAPGADIVVSRSGGNEVMVASVADAAGRFELAAVAGWVLVGARLPGQAPSLLQGCAPPRDIELVLPGAGAGLDGVVVDAAGTPVQGAAVLCGSVRTDRQRFDPRGFLTEPRAAGWQRTDAEGRFRAVDLPAGELNLLVRADGHAPLQRYVDTKLGEVVRVRCELGAGCAVDGVVVDGEGVPVVGAYVFLGGSGGELRRTDAAGRFGFRAAAAMLQPLRVEAFDIAPCNTQRDLAAEPGEWRVVVQRLPRYLLRFVDEQGAPLVGWTVVVRASRFQPVVTDADGRCRVPAPADDLGPLAVAPPDNARAAVPCAWPAGIAAGIESTIVVPASALPSAVIAGSVRDVDGAPLFLGGLAVLRADGRYVSWHDIDRGTFATGELPPGDYVLQVLRQGRGTAGARFAVDDLQRGERRDVGALRLPAEGQLLLHVVCSDGTAPRAASVFLYSGDHAEHSSPADGAPHPWPQGRYEWLVMDDDSLWQRGTVEVRAGELASVEIVLQPAVRRYLQFPVPLPAWGKPMRVDYVLRAPDGSVYDRGDFDPRDELPYRYCPPLSVGRWTLELATDGGQRLAGAFEVASMAPSNVPIRVAVQPAR